MPTPRHDTLCLRLIFILILLIGFCVSGCGDSEEAEALTEEAAEPLVVTILDSWSDRPAVPTRSDAEILADRILERETEGFYFDITRRNQLVGEIEEVLSLIRAAYLPMGEIHARAWSEPGMLWIRLERDFSEILKELIEDKQGQIRFETGNADFDALNAKLGLQNVILSWDLFLYFDRHLNLRTAIEAYSKVEGVRQVLRNPAVGDSNDIDAFKQGATWYVIFRNGWGDCPSGCIYRELFCFTVMGTAVERIPTAQAQTMPPFQGLVPEGDWERHNATPFVNATAHSWSWRDSRISDRSARSAGYDLGCSLFGEIEAFPNLLSVSCGYRVESLPREDTFIDNYDFTGVVLLLVATQERMVVGNSEAHSSVVASKTVLAAKTAAEIEQPENVYFENVLMPINPPPLSSPFERWWGGVHPTFVVCWDRPQTGLRAYQFIESDIRYAGSDEVRNHPGCDNFRDTDYMQTLDVYLPLLDIRDDIDEVLPRP
ncbi:hypothetical protein C6502_12955 [Candidatus Poribacteria bacterium]|nr:MAG: hypothetical protein C6502_12955 [Candidatus Poribacteria bacterium]